jgi:hypothetical protein
VAPRLKQAHALSKRIGVQAVYLMDIDAKYYDFCYNNSLDPRDVCFFATVHKLPLPQILKLSKLTYSYGITLHDAVLIARDFAGVLADNPCDILDFFNELLSKVYAACGSTHRATVLEYVDLVNDYL